MEHDLFLLHFSFLIKKKKHRKEFRCFSVVPRGFEPRLREPKSPVLPLYYGTILLLIVTLFGLLSKLPRNESNTRQKNQNLLYYHYTTGQSVLSVIAQLQCKGTANF